MRRGYTLLELVLTALSVAVLAIVVGAAWGLFTPAIYSLRDRTRGVTELRMALEYLRQDFAGVEAALPTLDGNLMITRNKSVAKLEGGWQAGMDQGVEYAFSAGRLVRRDVKPNTEVVVALNLNSFVVDQPDPSTTRVVLSAGEGQGVRTVTLLWEAP